MWARVFAWWWGALFSYVGRSGWDSNCGMHAEWGCRKVCPLCLVSFLSARHYYTNALDQQQDSENSLFCTQRLAITGTNTLALADQKLSPSFSTVDEAFLLSWSAFCLLHPPHPSCWLFLLFLPPVYLNLQFLVRCSFPTLLLCFCLRSSFSKSPAPHSAGSKDTCGGCVHSCAFVIFIKGKPAEWNCSFLNNWRDGETGRQNGDEGRGSWRQEEILTFSVHLWISKSVIDGRFEGRFQKDEIFAGWIGYTRYCQKKRQKVEKKIRWNSSSVFEQLILPWNAQSVKR